MPDRTNRAARPTQHRTPSPARFVLATPLLALALATGCASTVRVSETVDPAPQAQQVDADFAAAADLARAHGGLTGQARADNAARIDALLARIDDATLAREAAALPPGDPLYAFAGRALLSRGLALPRPFDSDGLWSLDGRMPAEADGYRPPAKVAMLLPLTGDLARAAAPVRDGFLAGYHGETRRKPEVVFHDTAMGGPLAAYNRAVADGADFVVGPLGRDEVASVFASGALSVPMLALNRAQDAPPAGHASFSLSPEDEGIAAAEYLLQRGQRRALVLVGTDESLGRSAQAFAKHFEARGGSVAQTFYVGGETADLAAALRVAAGAGLPTPPPAAEGPPATVPAADAVFLAVRAPKAREVVPQLSMAGLSGLPRVATSQLTLGTGDAGEDALLDGIAFPAETWTVRGVAGLPSADALGARLPTARGGAARLFAFGYDAWLLTAYPELAAGMVEGRLRGATGVLAIDAVGNVLRSPAWSTFRGGRQVPLADGAGG